MFIKAYFRSALILMACLLLQACAATRSEPLMVTSDGHQLETVTEKYKDGEQYVTVSNRTWTDAYAGEDEKFQMRKDLMFKVGREEIAKVCKGDDYTLLREPYYEMTSSDPVVPPYGLIGALAVIAVANATADETVIPRSMILKFKCNEAAAP